MSIRTSKILIRLVLILISFQFLAPSFLWSTEQKISASVSTEKSIRASIQKITSLSLFLERIEEEREDDRHKLINFEATDLLFLASRHTKVDASYCTYTNRTNQFDSQPPLFVLHCKYII